MNRLFKHYTIIAKSAQQNTKQQPFNKYNANEKPNVRKVLIQFQTVFYDVLKIDYIHTSCETQTPIRVLLEYAQWSF